MMVSVFQSHVVAAWFILCSICSYSAAHGTQSSQRLLASKSSLKQQCNAVGNCEMCKSSDIGTSAACRETGRRQQFFCTSDGQAKGKTILSDCLPNLTELAELTTLSRGQVSGIGFTSEVYRSCKATEADDEFAMVRFQVFCFFLGSVAFASAKKQMRLSSSLFDQRKRGQQPISRRQTDQRENELEMSQFEEETRRLVWNTSNPLEVI